MTKAPPTPDLSYDARIPDLGLYLAKRRWLEEPPQLKPSRAASHKATPGLTDAQFDHLIAGVPMTKRTRAALHARLVKRATAASVELVHGVSIVHQHIAMSRVRDAQPLASGHCMLCGHPLQKPAR